jgi:hypothetical protein
MTTIIAELYDALRQAGVADETAKAARAVIGLEHAAAKSDITDLRASRISLCCAPICVRAQQS